MCFSFVQIKFIRSSAEKVAELMTSAGAHPGYAEVYTSMDSALATAGLHSEVLGGVRALTGRAPFTFDEYAAEVKDAWSTTVVE